MRRITSEPVHLNVDNSPSLRELQADGVTIVCMPPITTSLYQPLDMGIISAAQRRYKARLLMRVLRDINAQLRSAAQPSSREPSAAAPRLSALLQPAAAPPLAAPSPSPPLPPPHSAAATPPAATTSSTASPPTTPPTPTTAPLPCTLVPPSTPPQPFTSLQPSMPPPPSMTPSQSTPPLPSTPQPPSAQPQPFAPLLSSRGVVGRGPFLSASSGSPTSVVGDCATHTPPGPATPLPGLCVLAGASPATGWPTLFSAPRSAAHAVGECQALPVAGFPYNVRLAVLFGSPGRRTVSVPFLARPLRPAPPGRADDDEAEENGGVGPALNLMNVCTLLKVAWQASSESTIAQCWLKANILSADTAAVLRSQHGTYHAGLPTMDAEVAKNCGPDGSVLGQRAAGHPGRGC